MTFQQRYKALEDEFKVRVQKDNEQFGWTEENESYYLPNIEPKREVDFVLVAMEPSSNARNPDGTSNTPRNFTWTVDDFILHYCVQHYLCNDDQTYHITDIAKGATKTDQAAKRRSKRWPEWYHLLEEELRLVSKPGAPVIALGGGVAGFLKKHRTPNLAGSIFHYSKNNSTARTVAPQLLPDQYREFSEGIGIADIRSSAEKIMASKVFDGYRDSILGNLSKDLTESGKQLLFTYKCLFAVILGKPLT